MPPTILPVDPIWQYVVTAGLVLLGQFIQAKNLKLPILSWLVSILTQQGTPAAPANPPVPAAPGQGPARFIPDLPNTKLDDYARAIADAVWARMQAQGLHKPPGP